MSSVSTAICRNIIETRDVVKAQLLETLVTELVAMGKVTKEECKDLSTKLNQHIDRQTDSLIDRIINELE